MPFFFKINLGRAGQNILGGVLGWQICNPGYPGNLLKISSRCPGFRLPILAAVGNLSERADEFVVRANLPGMKQEDIELTVDENSLTLRGESREEETGEDEHFYRRERRSGSFVRHITLHSKIRPEEVKATFRDGVLEVRLPKAERTVSRGRRVEIQ